MELGDFSKNFDQIDICHRATGLQDLRLSTHEDQGCLGEKKEKKALFRLYSGSIQALFRLY
jgi:hypothetical protein